jgi:monomeric sarcosine oxidase
MVPYERIVVGVGGVGSAALYHLARQGVRVLGIEQFGVAHDRGSSHGQTRIIRQAYFEHPDYVPLLVRAYELWRDLEESTGERLFDQVGLLEAGPADGIVIPGIRQSVAQHGLAIESLTADEARKRFPAFTIPHALDVVFEPTAGLLYVERCVAAQIREAQRCGADLLTETPIERLEFTDTTVIVHTPGRRWETEGIVCCAGPWSRDLFAETYPLQVQRKHLHWYATRGPAAEARAGCPTFLFELPHGCFYGFPAVDRLGVKVAEHSGGENVSHPTDVDRTLDADDERRVADFVRQYLAAVTLERQHHAVCMYTRTPDDHFLIDWHPQHERSVVAAGLSGHGFKFVPVLGEVLAEMTLTGATRWPVEFLRAGRFQA